MRKIFCLRIHLEIRLVGAVRRFATLRMIGQRHMLAIHVLLFTFLIFPTKPSCAELYVGPGQTYTNLSSGIASKLPLSENLEIFVIMTSRSFSVIETINPTSAQFNGFSITVRAVSGIPTTVAYSDQHAVWTGQTSLTLAYENIAGPGGQEGRVAAGSPKFLLKDHLGTTRTTVDENGALVDQTMYYSYGKMVKLISSASESREKFTSKEFDTDGGADGQINLNYFGARYYEPEIGLWISPDPMQQYHSPYSYSSNPVNTVDPDGQYDMVINESGGASIENSPIIKLEHVYADVGGQRYETNGSFSVFTAAENTMQLISFAEGAGVNMVTMPAWSGKAGAYDPLPLGAYSFYSEDVQRISNTSAWNQLKGHAGGGTFPGGRSSWGEARAWLKPYPSARRNIAAAGRDPFSFTIHGGSTPGSRGCIDLLHNENFYFGLVPPGKQNVFSR